MPLVAFICPDNCRIPVADCLKEGGCRMGERCATRSYLQLVSRERPWTGKPSTTQLIGGTLYAFLKLTKDYAASPDGRAFMINGTKGHGNLESADDEFSLLEEKFQDSDISGISDVLETENSETVLADYKVSGSFKVAKALGFYVEEEPTGEFITRGKNKGNPKMRKILKRSLDKTDRKDWTLQLNKYRIEAKKKHPALNILKLKIQCLVRDGNTYMARSRGVYRNIYYFNIDILPDEEVNKYFNDKKEALLQALKQGYWDHICTKEENWDGLRCERYCEVAEFCSYGKFLKLQKQSEDDMIKGLSDVRRFPRLGKIRLGKRVPNKSGNGDHPVEVDYFILDPSTPVPEERERLIQEFKKKYGDEPKSIDIMLPHPDINLFFPQFFKRYGGNHLLKCVGDGEMAECSSVENAAGLEIVGDSERGWKKVRCAGTVCPYYQNRQCAERGTLNVLLPQLPGIGCWQIETGSYHGIVGVNSGLDGVRNACGRVHMIPLKLERRPIETNFEGKKMTHFPLFISQEFRLADLQKYALIDATRVALELPAPDPDKEDIEFQANVLINPPGTPQEPAAAPAASLPLAPEPPKPAKEPVARAAAVEDRVLTLAERKIITDEVLKRKIPPAQFKLWLKETFGAETTAELRLVDMPEVLLVVRETPDMITYFQPKRQRQPGEE
jgi:Recombination directionality factor-like